LLQQKVDQKVATFGGYSIFSKNQKVAQLVKHRPIWSPWTQFKGQIFMLVVTRQRVLSFLKRLTVVVNRNFLSVLDFRIFLELKYVSPKKILQQLTLTGEEGSVQLTFLY
jgi:hypothetical protein